MNRQLGKVNVKSRHSSKNERGFSIIEVIAKFDRTSGGFLAPSFHTNGGGTSNIQYDSTALGKSLTSAMNVSGVLEF